MEETQQRYVYLIRWREIYKIGCSANQAARFEELIPRDEIADGEAELVHDFPSDDAYGVERCLHWCFADRDAHCMGREWFHLGFDDIEALRLLGRTDSPDDLPPVLRGERPARRGEALHAWVDPDLMAALNDYISRQEVRTSKTAVIEAALREWLRVRGSWPRPPAGPS